MKDLDGFTVAIVGLGLMGGSLAMALKQNGIGRRVIGADRNPSAVTRALELGAIDATCEDCGAADLVVLAMPVLGIISWLGEQGKHLRKEQVVMDLGSTKAKILGQMQKLDAQCIGAHPMCGKETSGIDAAEASLFQGAKFVLTPLARTSADTLSIAQQLVGRVGAVPLLMDADTHDRYVALVSHVPYLLSAGLMNVVADLKNDEPALSLASSGFASATRLAASDTQMMADIIVTNREFISTFLLRMQAELNDLSTAIESGDEAHWRARLERAWQAKRGMQVG